MSDQRQAAVDYVRATVRRIRERQEEEAFIGRLPSRVFVCQGCATAHTVLYGSTVTCPCGVTSAAEVLPP